MDSTQLMMLIAGLAMVLGIFGGISAYNNGTVDGYGYGREPGNPGYQKAGRHLRKFMAHRWPELGENGQLTKAHLVAQMQSAIAWNPFNKVVQDHCDGTIDHEATNRERAKRGLPVPWEPAMGDKEVRESPIY